MPACPTVSQRGGVVSSTSTGKVGFSRWGRRSSVRTSYVSNVQGNWVSGGRREEESQQWRGGAGEGEGGEKRNVWQPTFWRTDRKEGEKPACSVEEKDFFSLRL